MPLWVLQILLSTSLYISVPGGLILQENSNSFRELTVEQGLSQNGVTSILQDSKGFMWIGTKDGLNRYDGYTFTNYFNEPHDPASLGNNSILQLHEGPTGIIWTLTETGLSRFDPRRERFTNYQYGGSDTTEAGVRAGTCLHEDSDGNLWIGTNAGIDRLNPESGQMSRIGDMAAPENQRWFTINDIYENAAGTLLFGTSIGLYQFDRGNESLSRIPAIFQGLDRYTVNAFHQGQDGSLLVFVNNIHLCRYDPDSNTLLPIVFPGLAGPPWGQGMIIDMCEDLEGRLWIITWLNEIFIVDLNNSQITRVSIDVIGAWDYLCAYTDRTGIVWIGTNGTGVRMWIPGLVKFTWYRNDPKAEISLSSASIRAIHEDSDGSLWVGGYGGLDRLDRRTGEIRRYSSSLPGPGSPSSNTARTITEDREYPERYLWIGTEGGGLNRYDRQTDTFKRYEYSLDGTRGLWGGIVNSIVEDDSGTLWIGTDRALNRFDKESGFFRYYRHDPLQSNSISNNNVLVIYIDSHGVFWAGTDRGLNRFDLEQEQFTHYRYDINDASSLSQDKVISICEDHTGTLWIGTAGGGLNRFDRASDSFTFFNTSDGLPNNVIYGIQEDAEGFLWLSTNKGLSRFDPRDNTCRNFNTSDGLQSLEFNYFSSHKSRSGEMFFGGIQGLNTFFPNEISDDLIAPPIVITEFQVNNNPVPIGETVNGHTILTESISGASELLLHYRENTLSFTYAALHYGSPAHNQYAYMLEGLENEWNYVGSERTASYIKLPPGNYIFRVKGANMDGTWNEEGSQLHIIIRPPFWATTLFRIVGLLGTISLVVTGFTIRTRTYRRRALHLEDINRKLAGEITERIQTEIELQQRERDLGERIKEQQCLYAISELSGRTDIPLAEILQGIINTIPQGWQYPDKTGARVIIEDQEYTTRLYTETEWKQSCEVTVGDEYLGVLEVCYLEEEPEEDEGPFLREESSLLHAIAEQLALIVERRRAVASQDRLEAQLRQSQTLETVGTLDGGIAHDFNNILTPIFGYLDMAQQEIHPDSPTHAKLEHVAKAANRAKELVRQILIFSRRAEQERQPMEMHLIVREALKLLEASLPSTIELRQILDADSGTVQVDPTQMHQVIMNLGTNAYQAMSESGGVLEVDLSQFEVDSGFAELHPNLHEGTHVLLSVSDTGHGMDQETAASIFEPFFTTKEIGEGTGLGLSIVHGIVINHGGEISVYSEPGVGTTLKIYIPVVDVDPVPIVQPVRVPVTGNERIMVVDDENSIAQLVQDILSNLGYAIVTHTDSAEALEEFSVHPDMYDLVVTDQTMPYMTGIQLAEELIRIRPDIPIIIMSGFSELLTSEKSKELGIRAFLTKPFLPYDLSSTIREVLDA